MNKTCTQDFKYNETVYPTQDEEETSTVIVCKCTNLTFVINVPQSAVNVTCTFNIIWPVCVLYIDFYHNHEKQLIIVHWQSSFMFVWKYFLNIHVPVFNFCSLWLQLFLFVYCASVEEHQEPVTEYLQSRIGNFSLSLTIELNYFILLLSNCLSSWSDSWLTGSCKVIAIWEE